MRKIIKDFHYKNTILTLEKNIDVYFINVTQKNQIFPCYIRITNIEMSIDIFYRLKILLVETGEINISDLDYIVLNKYFKTVIFYDNKARSIIQIDPKQGKTLVKCLVEYPNNDKSNFLMLTSVDYFTEEY